MKNIAKYAIMNALGASIYVILVALFIYSIGNGLLGDEDIIFIPIAMLMLFVFSAAFTGFLIFGKPVMWYLDGKKRKALIWIGQIIFM